MSQFVGQNVGIDWSKIDLSKLGGDDFGIRKYDNQKVLITSTPVLCKDGTTKIQQSSPNAEYMDACVNNGGRAVNQPVSVKPRTSEVKQQNLLAGGNNTLTAEDKFYEMLGIKKTDGSGWGLQSRPVGRLLVAVVLVAGYFAYKKFKK